MSSVTKTDMKGLGNALHVSLSKMAKQAPEEVADEVRLMSFKMKRKAAGFYDTVLRRRSGNLFRSTKRFTRRRVGRIHVGLDNKMKYAKWLDQGTKNEDESVRIKAREFMSKPVLETGQEINETLLKRLRLA